MRAHRDWNHTDRILPPMSGLIAREIIDPEARLWNLRAIISTQCKDGSGSVAAQSDAVGAFIIIVLRSQILRQQRIECRCLRREHSR